MEVNEYKLEDYSSETFFVCFMTNKSHLALKSRTSDPRKAITLYQEPTYNIVYPLIVEAILTVFWPRIMNVTTQNPRGDLNRVSEYCFEYIGRQ